MITSHLDINHIRWAGLYEIFHTYEGQSKSLWTLPISQTWYKIKTCYFIFILLDICFVSRPNMRLKNVMNAKIFPQIYVHVRPTGISQFCVYLSILFLYLCFRINTMQNDHFILDEFCNSCYRVNLFKFVPFYQRRTSAFFFFLSKRTFCIVLFPSFVMNT